MLEGMSIWRDKNASCDVVKVFGQFYGKVDFT